MAEEFYHLQDYLKALNTVYIKGLMAFSIFDAMSELTAPNIVGEITAKENNYEVMNKYKDFFVITKESNHFHAIVQLAKWFDIDDRPLSIYKILNFAEASLEKLSKEAFEEFNQDREFIEELVKDYEPINKNDLIEIRKMLHSHQDIIENLRKYRHSLCHALLVPMDIKLTIGDLMNIIKIIGEIYNLFTKKTNHETTYFDHIPEACKEDTKIVFDHLRRFEPYRLKEIEVKYKTLRNQENG